MYDVADYAGIAHEANVGGRSTLLARPESSFLAGILRSIASLLALFALPVYPTDSKSIRLIYFYIFATDTVYWKTLQLIVVIEVVFHQNFGTFMVRFSFVTGTFSGEDLTTPQMRRYTTL